jgi:hypothetical protein
MRQILLVSLLLLLLVPQARAFDLMGTDRTYLNQRTMYLNFGTGMNSLVGDNGVKADGYDLGWQLGLGYSFTRRLQLELLYSVDSVPIVSPNPISGGSFSSKFFFISEAMRLIYRFDTGFFDRWLVFPYLSLGVGFYQMAAVNPQSGLDFPSGFQLPFGGGLETYLNDDRLSLSLDYTYHLLFDEEQNTGVLSLLGVSEVKFDVHSIKLLLNWHFF